MNEQASCLVSAHNPRFMTAIFDNLPPVVRQVIRDSPYDLCAACFDNEWRWVGGASNLTPDHQWQIAMRIRLGMELRIRVELDFV